MKKTFKKFLSGTLATIMATSCLVVGTVSSVYAADYTNGTMNITDEAKKIKVWDFTTNMPSGDKNTDLNDNDTVNGIVFQKVGDGSNLNKGSYLSIKKDAVILIPVPENSTGSINLVCNTNDADRIFTLSDTNPVELPMAKNNGSTAKFTADASKEGYLMLTNTSASSGDSEYKLYTLTVTLDDGFEFDDQLTEYTWSIDESELKIELAGNLKLAKDTTTITQNTISYDGTDYTLIKEYETVTGIPDDKNEIVVKPQDDWFEQVVPKEYVNVEPTVTGNKTVYDFESVGNAYLVSTKSGSKTETSAYTDFSKDAGNDTNCWVELNGDKGKGAYLYDDSTSSATKLIIPYSANSGKVTVSGTITPTNSVGSKWTLVNLGVVSLAADGNTNVVIASANDGKDENTAGKLTKDVSVEYSITVDFGTQTASGTVKNGSATKEFKDVSFKNGQNSIDNITFTTNDGKSVGTRDDRGLLVSSVTIEKEDAKIASTKQKVGSSSDYYAVDTANGNTYIIHAVTEGELANPTLALQGIGDKAVAETDTVYTAVEFTDGSTISATDLSAKAIYAVCVTGTGAAAPSGTFTWISK